MYAYLYLIASASGVPHHLIFLHHMHEINVLISKPVRILSTCNSICFLAISSYNARLG